MLLLALACGLVCNQPVNLAVTATAGPQAKSETRFVMVASDPHVRPANPDYIAISKAVARALAAQGFEPAKTEDDSNLVVVIDWMVGDPKEVVRHVGGDAGAPAVAGAPPGGRGGMPVGGTNNSASFGFGLDAQDQAHFVWVRTYMVKGVDKAAYKADPAAKPLWEMTVASEGESDDAAAAAPAVMAGAMPYIGQTTGKTVKFRISATDDSVKYMRGDIPALPEKK
jgi:hypothetical protein